MRPLAQTREAECIEGLADGGAGAGEDGADPRPPAAAHQALFDEPRARRGAQACREARQGGMQPPTKRRDCVQLVTSSIRLKRVLFHGSFLDAVALVV